MAKSPEPKLDELDRSPEEAAAMAREVMGRMLAMPPTPHSVAQSKKRAKKPRPKR